MPRSLVSHLSPWTNGRSQGEMTYEYEDEDEDYVDRTEASARSFIITA